MSEDLERDTNLTDYWLKIAGTATVVLITIIISMTSFWMMIGKDYITRDETRIVIKDELQLVDISLQNHSAILAKINQTIEQNTNTIVELKLALGSLSSLGAMEKRLTFLEDELKSIREEQIRRTGSIQLIEKLDGEMRTLREEMISLNNTIKQLANK